MTDQESYIRGAGPVPVNARRLGWMLAVAGVAVLAACSVTLAVLAASGDSSAASLRRHGVPVRVTVTSCTAITSGIGMGAEYFECRGMYTLGGETVEAVIHGSRAQLGRGTVVPGLAIPGKPSSLALAGPPSSSTGGRYAASIVLGALALAGAGLMAAARLARRAGSRSRSR